MEPLARFMLWVAVAAWVGVAAMFLARPLGSRQLGHRQQEG